MDTGWLPLWPVRLLLLGLPSAEELADLELMVLFSAVGFALGKLVESLAFLAPEETIGCALLRPRRVRTLVELADSELLGLFSAVGFAVGKLVESLAFMGPEETIGCALF